MKSYARSMASKIVPPQPPPPTYEHCYACGRTVKVPDTPWETCKETEPPPPAKAVAELGDEPEHRQDGLRVNCILLRGDQGRPVATQAGGPPANYENMRQMQLARVQAAKKTAKKTRAPKRKR
jgi:hypothetical protein